MMKQIGIFLFVSLCAQAEDKHSEFKMGFRTGLSYSNNPYSLTDVQIKEKSVGDMMENMHPQLSLVTRGKKLSLSLNGDGNLNALFGFNHNPRSLIFTGTASGDATYNQNGIVSFFTQSSLSASRNIGELFIGNITTLTGKTTLGSVVRPGGGKLSLSLQGEYSVQGYPGLTYLGKTSQPTQLNNQTYYLASRLSWQFLPKTALYLEGRTGFFENIEANDNHLTINPLWVGAGLTGRITPTLIAHLSAHFSKIFIKNNLGALSSGMVPLGVAVGLDWTPTAKSSLGLSISREIAPAPIFLEQNKDFMNLKYNQTFFTKLIFSLDSQIGILKYGKSLNYRIQEGYSERSDWFTGAQLSLSYSFMDWMAFGISGERFWRWTNANPYNITTSTNFVAAGAVYRSLFSRYQGNVFVQLTY